jgi:hypothetical protein
MAFEYLGEITGGQAPKKNLQIGADVYAGQMAQYSGAAGGRIIPVAAAAAGPDTTVIAGIVLGPGRFTSPGTNLYDSTYKGDKITYDTTQATVVVNDPKGAAIAEVQTLTPNSLIKAPIVKDTIGTAPECKACTTGSADGLTFVVATIDTTVDDYSTAYCRTGANQGEYRVVTTGATTTQTFTIPFTNDIAVGDTFCIANVTEGLAHISWDTQFQAVDSSYDPSTNYFVAIVHEVNLEKAGEEYCTFRLASRHLG